MLETSATILIAGSIAGFAAVLLYAAYTDLRSLRISNQTCLVGLGSFGVYAAAYAMLGMTDWLLPTFGLALAVFVITATMNMAGALGGGDVKLMTVIALWTGPTETLKICFIIAIIGGLIALGLILKHTLTPNLAPAHPGTPAMTARPIPYGPAITLGGLYHLSELILNGFY